MNVVCPVTKSAFHLHIHGVWNIKKKEKKTANKQNEEEWSETTFLSEVYFFSFFGTFFATFYFWM